MEKVASKEMDYTKRNIASIRCQVRLAKTVQKQSELQDELQKLEKLQRKQQRQIFDIEDEITGKRDKLISDLTKRKKQ